MSARAGDLGRRYGRDRSLDVDHMAWKTADPARAREEIDYLERLLRSY